MDKKYKQIKIGQFTAFYIGLCTSGMIGAMVGLKSSKNGTFRLFFNDLPYILLKFGFPFVHVFVPTIQ